MQPPSTTRIKPILGLCIPYNAHAYIMNNMNNLCPDYKKKDLLTFDPPDF